MQFYAILFPLSALIVMVAAQTGQHSADGVAETEHRENELCIEELGCLKTSDRWHNTLHRPINLSPDSRERINTTFKLYCKSNSIGEEIKRTRHGISNLRSCNANKETKFIVHGFHTGAYESWITNLTKHFISLMDVNVITVEWSEGSRSPYVQAVANARVVGLEIAYLIKGLIEEKGASARMFHLIGHSLGAHVAGYAGQRIEGLGRITGLDPAGVGFINMPAYVRLDRTDAILVDVIHTDAEFTGYGMEESIGDIDFYPNGGYRQPGCERTNKNPFKVTDSLISGRELPSCSHTRSQALFLESLVSSPFLNPGEQNCPFVGFLCESYEDFLNGECASCGHDGTKCALRGIDADKYPYENSKLKLPRKFYLKTNAVYPFCGNHYALHLTRARVSRGLDTVAGDLSANVFGEDGVAVGIDFTHTSRRLSKGSTNIFVGISNSSVGHINAVEIKWTWNSNIINRILCKAFCTTDLILSDVGITNLGLMPEQKTNMTKGCHDILPIDIRSGSTALIPLNC